MANTPIPSLTQSLQDYAFGVAQDLQAILELANALAPIVVTGAKHIKYATFNSDVMYQAPVAKRGLGAKRERIIMQGSATTVDLSTKGLEIGIDDQEWPEMAVGTDGGATKPAMILQQAKIMELINLSYLSHVNEVVTVAKAGVTAAAGIGNWSSANVDPIAEIDAQLLNIARFRKPNQIIMDVGAWKLIKNNPLVNKRWIASGGPTLEQFAGVLLIPDIKIILTPVAINTLGLGNASQSKKGIINNEVWCMYNSPTPSVFDSSFMKTFSVNKELFGGIAEYRDEGSASQVYYADWHAMPALVSTSLVARIAAS